MATFLATLLCHQLLYCYNCVIVLENKLTFSLCYKALIGFIICKYL